MSDRVPRLQQLLRRGGHQQLRRLPLVLLSALSTRGGGDPGHGERQEKRFCHVRQDEDTATGSFLVSHDQPCTFPWEVVGLQVHDEWNVIILKYLFHLSKTEFDQMLNIYREPLNIITHPHQLIMGLPH